MMQKHIRGGLTEWLLIALAAALFLLALALPVRMALSEEWNAEERKLWDAYQSGDLIRLHVLANSDSPEDQAIKLQVRDALIETFGQILTGSDEQSSDALFETLRRNIGHMQQTAQSCAQRCGFTGSVSAEAGILHLPSKQYGKVTLPEGEYRALRVTLGEGAGQNWWCVLYPQLCISLAETEEPSAVELFWSSERILRHWLLMDV